MGISLDNFTDAAGTTLLNHKGDKNALWIDVPALTDTGSFLISDANRLRYGTSGNVGRLLSAVPWTNEFDLTFTFQMITNVAAWQIRFRWDTATTTYYQIRFNSSTSQIRFERIVSGSATTLGNSSYTFAANTALAVKVEIRNGTKKVFINGAQTFSTTDNTITATGRIAVVYVNSTTMNNATGIHLDSMEVASPHLFGNVAASSARRAVPHLTHHVIGKARGKSANTAQPRITHHVAGRAAGASVKRATARAARHLQGRAVGAGKAVGVFHLTHHITGRAAGAGRAVAVFHLTHHFGGHAIGTGRAVGLARIDHHLMGHAAGGSIIDGALRVRRPLAGRAISGSVISAHVLRVRLPQLADVSLRDLLRGAEVSLTDRLAE